MTARAAHPPELTPLELTRRAALARCLAARPAAAAVVGYEVEPVGSRSSTAGLAPVLEFAGVAAMLVLFMAAAILA